MGDLGAGEVSVDDQTCSLAKRRLQSVGFESLAHRGRDAALPNDGVGHGLARAFFPNDCGFALVGDAHGGHVGRAAATPRESVFGHGELRLPDRFWIVLDVPRLGIDLLELFLGRGDGPALASEENRPAGGCPLIQSQHTVGHKARSLRQIAV
jgi:hypothetical protein